MYQSTYYVHKGSDTQADSLMAYGLAELVQAIIPPDAWRIGPGLLVEDKGPYYQVVLPEGLAVQPEWLDDLPDPLELAPFVKSGKEKPPSGFLFVRDADQEWDNFKAYNKARSEMRSADIAGKAVDTDAARTLDSLRPKADFSVVSYISDYRMQGLGVHNKLVLQWWRTRAVRKQHIQALLRFFADPTGQNTDKIVTAWNKDMKAAKLKPAKQFTASQMFNPHTGKGANRPKADSMITPGNEKSFWLLEYLKVAGMWSCAAPRMAQSGGIRKTYVLAAAHVPLLYHREVFRKFNEAFWNDGAIKLDIIAVLRYIVAMLDHIEVEEDDFASTLFDTPPGEYVNGFYVTTYQQLSANAYTMMNQGFIGLPDWARVTDAWGRADLQAAIKEHIDRIRALDEGRNEGYVLLQYYRDFVSSNQWNKLFDFLAGYGRFLLSQLERGNYYVKPFSRKNMWRLLMSNGNYSEILQDPGFQNVAKAIRLSTIVPQYRGRRDSLYEIRYGLGQKFKKSAHYKEDFLTVLADFMHSYNEENALKQERHGKSYRANLTKGDVEAIVALIDQHNAQLICNLLLAYGFARDPKETAPNQTTEEM